jgi:hypothetical protein
MSEAVKGLLVSLPSSPSIKLWLSCNLCTSSFNKKPPDNIRPGSLAHGISETDNDFAAQYRTAVIISSRIHFKRILKNAEALRCWGYLGVAGAKCLGPANAVCLNRGSRRLGLNRRNLEGTLHSKLILLGFPRISFK